MMVRFRSLLKIYGKVLGLLLMMALGMMLPQFHRLSFLIQYLLMAMLFFAFMDIDIQPASFQKGVLWVAAANLGVAFGSYGLLSYFDHTLALAAFMTGIAPTAIAAPVIISFIQGKVPYVASAVLLTNILVALVVPVTLPWMVGPGSSSLLTGAAVLAPIGQISVWQVLEPVLITMFVPLILARLAAYLPKNGQAFIRRGKALSFPLWLINLFLISAKAADFMRGELTASNTAIAAIALISLSLCIANFVIGALLGGRNYWQEASQALGQKNNSFVIWIALTFLNPLVAMGPTFYVLYHNLYNSWQIYLFEKRRS